MIIRIGRNATGVTFELSLQERKSFPNGAPRVFVALEPEERDVPLRDLLNDVQAYAVASLLTRTEAKGPLQFVDAVNRDTLMEIGE